LHQHTQTHKAELNHNHIIIIYEMKCVLQNRRNARNDCKQGRKYLNCLNRNVKYVKSVHLHLHGIVMCSIFVDLAETSSAQSIDTDGWNCTKLGLRNGNWIS
jgi:hypothetical protein